MIVELAARPQRSALTIVAAPTRARDERRFQRAVTQTDLREPPGRCRGLRPHDGEVAGGAVEIFVLANLVGDDAGARAIDDDDDAAPAGARSELRGHRQQIGKSAALTEGRGLESPILPYSRVAVGSETQQAALTIFVVVTSQIDLIDQAPGAVDRTIDLDRTAWPHRRRRLCDSTPVQQLR